MENRGIWRGKRLDNGEWIIGDLSRTQAADHFFITNYRHYFGFGVDTTTLGECTCLRDKNGKLIFEGDIVENTRKERSVIEFDEKHAAFHVSFNRTGVFSCSKIEIIGNIHDNPELIQEGAAE